MDPTNQEIKSQQMDHNQSTTTTTTTSQPISHPHQTIRAINIAPSTSGNLISSTTTTTRQIILSKSQASLINRSLQASGSGGAVGPGQIIVLAPANRTGGLNDSTSNSIQLVIQQKPANSQTITPMISNASNQKIFVQTPGSSISMLKNIQMNKPRLTAATTAVVSHADVSQASQVQKPALTEIKVVKSASDLVQQSTQNHQQTANGTIVQQPNKIEFQSSANAHIIGLLNSNRTMQTLANPTDNNNHNHNPSPNHNQKIKKEPQTSNSSNQTVASLINSRLQQQLIHQQQQQQQQQQQLQQVNNTTTNRIITQTSIEKQPLVKQEQQVVTEQPNPNQFILSLDSVLNQLILPDTRIFSTLLNKEADAATSSNKSQENSLRCKKVFIGNREHVILDNSSNLSDFKGDFGGLKSLASSIADKLNLPVSIPAFLMIDDETCIDRIKGVLREQSINPIIIEMRNNSSEQKPAVINESTKPVVEEPSSAKKIIRRKKTEIEEKLDSEPTSEKKPVAAKKKRTDSKPSTPRPKKKTKVDDVVVNSPKLAPIEQQQQPVVNNNNQNMDQHFHLINQFIDTLNSNENDSRSTALINPEIKHEASSIGLNQTEIYMDQLDASIAKNSSTKRQNLVPDCELNFDTFDVNMLLNDIELQKDFF